MECQGDAANTDRCRADCGWIENVELAAQVEMVPDKLEWIRCPYCVDNCLSSANVILARYVFPCVVHEDLV